VGSDNSTPPHRTGGVASASSTPWWPTRRPSTRARARNIRPSFWWARRRPSPSRFETFQGVAVGRNCWSG
jgi:hypothetical protein